jgi:bla regulator protein blaR1
MTGWMIETLIATTLLMIAVLALRDVVTRHFGPRIAYLLWLAPALRMALPPIPAEWVWQAKGPVQSVVVVLEGASSLSFQPTIAVGSGIIWLDVILAVWIGGAALFFVWHALGYIRFSRRVMAAAEPLFDQDRIRIASSSGVSSPVAFGFVGKTIVVPVDFERRFSAVEQRLALAHEMAHHMRRDLLINLGALAMLALHWFNPIAHFAHRAFRLDQEAACDATVLEGATPDERHAYGSALFKSATGAVPFAVCAMGTTTQLKARLQRIIMGRKQARGLRAGTMITGLLVLTGLAVTASGGVAAEAAAKIEDTSTVVLGGGIVDVEPADVALAEQQTEAADVAATRANDRANDAWADSEPAEADVARAKADGLRAQADATRQEADAIRARADQRRGLAMAGIEPPSPPAPPAPPEPPVVAKVITKVKCADTDRIQRIETPDHNIVICIKNAAIQASIREALIDARDDINSDLEGTEEPMVRAKLTQAVAAIDRQISRMEAHSHRIE